MNVLVTGITGYVGSRLAPQLVQAGHRVRGFARRPGPAPAGVEVVRGDAVTGVGLARALAGMEVAYFLIHSMEPAGEPFGERERAAAANFAGAAAAAGVRRTVFLGGLLPDHGPMSAHLASRLAVEEILAQAAPCPVALRASIVIGAGSRSFRFLVRLVERLPVLAVPAWSANRTSPVDERDIIALLVRAATSERVCDQSLDVGGRDVVSYGELIDRIRYHMLVNRPTVRFRRLTVTPIASHVAAVIAGEDHELIGPLMDSLATDLLPRDNRIYRLLGVRPHSLDAAIEHALREWETVEPLAAR